MKRSLSALLAGVLVLSLLAGCSGGNTAATPVPAATPAQSTPAPQQTPAAPETHVVVDSIGREVPLPVKDGFIILNRALEQGDRVLLRRVQNGQKFLILSRVFEQKEAAYGNPSNQQR